MSSNDSSQAKSTSNRRFVILALAFLVVIAGALWFGRNLQAPRAESLERLEEVKSFVLSFADEKGGLPESLDELISSGHLSELPKDRVGSLIRYQRLRTSDAELVSFGPDGKEGGFMFKADTRIEFSWPEDP